MCNQLYEKEHTLLAMHQLAGCSKSLGIHKSREQQEIILLGISQIAYPLELIWHVYYTSNMTWYVIFITEITSQGKKVFFWSCTNKFSGVLFGLFSIRQFCKHVPFLCVTCQFNKTPLWDRRCQWYNWYNYTHKLNIIHIAMINT